MAKSVRKRQHPQTYAALDASAVLALMLAGDADVDPREAADRAAERTIKAVEKEMALTERST